MHLFVVLGQNEAFDPQQFIIAAEMLRKLGVLLTEEADAAEDLSSDTPYPDVTYFDAPDNSAHARTKAEVNQQLIEHLEKCLNMTQ